jgi:short subunit dehydrogenase-like uncharacterized protein
MPDIVVFGATGYTGDLVARALVARGRRPVLAARNAERLGALAAELGGLETRVADVERPDSVQALVRRGDVLVSTVGPFARWGEPAVQGAIAAGAHYLDSTGEPAFIRDVFQRHGPAAATAGVGLLTAFGYDWVPGNLAGGLALDDAGPAATAVEIGYFTTGESMGAGAMSGGTRASAAGVLLAPGHAFRGGRLVIERGARRLGTFETAPGRRAAGISTGGSEHFALPRVQRALRDVDVFLGWFGPLSRPLQVLSLAQSLVTRIPGVRPAIDAAVRNLVSGSSGGPDATARSRSGSLVLARALDTTGRELSSVRLEGPNGYDVTADLLAWGAETALAGGLQGTGALGPVDGFGLAALRAGAEQAGLRRVG